MGMSASQVRFLSLQGRKNNIGRELSTLSNRKMSLSRDMQAVSSKYTNALNQTHLKFSNDAGRSYNDIDYKTLMTPNPLSSVAPYILTDAKTGKVVLNNDDITDYENNVIKFTGTITDSDGTTTTYNDRALKYTDLARMISNYNPTTINMMYTQNGNTILSAGGGGTPGDSGERNIEGYTIPKNVYDYTVEGGARTNILKMLGILTPEKISEYDNYINQLYGSRENMISGIYPADSLVGKLKIAQQNYDAFNQMVQQEYYVAFGNIPGITEDDYQETIQHNLVNYNISSKTSSSKTLITQTDTDAGLREFQVDYSNVTTTTLLTSYDFSGSHGLKMDVYMTPNGIKYTYELDNIYNYAGGNLTCADYNNTSDVCSSYNGHSLRDVYSNAGTSLRIKTSHDNLYICENVFHTYTDLANSYIDKVGNYIRNIQDVTMYNIDDSLLESAKDRAKSLFDHICDIHGNHNNSYMSTGFNNVYGIYIALNHSYEKDDPENPFSDWYEKATWYARITDYKDIYNLVMTAYCELVNDQGTATNNLNCTGSGWYRSYGSNASKIANGDLKNKFKTSLNPGKFSEFREKLQQDINYAQLQVNKIQDRINTVFTKQEQQLIDYYDALFLRIAQNGWTTDDKTGTSNTNDKEYLDNKLQNNDFYITECKQYEGVSSFKYMTKIASNVSSVYSVHDSSAENAALAEYESQKSLIHLKEQKIDNRMQKLETEQEAITQEMEGIKKVIEDNIGVTFKIFS